MDTAALLRCVLTLNDEDDVEDDAVAVAAAANSLLISCSDSSRTGLLACVSVLAILSWLTISCDVDEAEAEAEAEEEECVVGACCG